MLTRTSRMEFNLSEGEGNPRKIQRSPASPLLSRPTGSALLTPSLLPTSTARRRSVISPSSTGPYVALLHRDFHPAQTSEPHPVDGVSAPTENFSLESSVWFDYSGHGCTNSWPSSSHPVDLQSFLPRCTLWVTVLFCFFQFPRYARRTDTLAFDSVLNTRNRNLSPVSSPHTTFQFGFLRLLIVNSGAPTHRIACQCRHSRSITTKCAQTREKYRFLPGFSA